MELKLDDEDRLELSSTSPPGTLDGSEVEVPKSGLLISVCGAADDGSCGLVRLKVSNNPITLAPFDVTRGWGIPLQRIPTIVWKEQSQRKPATQKCEPGSRSDTARGSRTVYHEISCLAQCVCQQPSSVSAELLVRHCRSATEADGLMAEDTQL